MRMLEGLHLAYEKEDSVLLNTSNPPKDQLTTESNKKGKR